MCRSVITFKKNENIFDSDAQVIVNPVNTVGVMSKGLALDFKNKYPKMFIEYKKACQYHLIDIGKLYYYPGNKCDERDIILFPTKKHWKNKILVSYIEKGLQNFVETYRDVGISSVAFPRIGCGLGGLDWENTVKPLIIKYLSSLEDIEVQIYE